MPLKFLSLDWCAAAMAAANANQLLYECFEEPATFDHRISLGLTGRDVTTYATFTGAKVTDWTTRPVHGPVDFGVRSRAEYYVELAEGTIDLGVLLVAGKLAIVEGDPRPALRNLRALEEFLRTFDRVDTDWDV